MALKVSHRRYEVVTDEKSDGVTYTPKALADFVACQIVSNLPHMGKARRIRILDPAIGDGELIISLLEHLVGVSGIEAEVYGFDTSRTSLNTAAARISNTYPQASLHFKEMNFLEFVLDKFGVGDSGSLFEQDVPETYDIIIANPPYVRTQIMGAKQAQMLAEQFGLSGRVDLYYAFMLAMARVLKPHGVAGIIVSNRFMTTRSGSPIRQAIIERFNVRYIWDLGDTKIFDAAVLPAVLLVEGRNGRKTEAPPFTSIYEVNRPPEAEASDPISALAETGVVQTGDGRTFFVQHGQLDTSGAADGVWRVATKATDRWLAKAEAHTWGVFGQIGKIRVGVKTCADKVFIRSDWHKMPDAERPELLKPLVTHHIAQRYKARITEHAKQILYPHEVIQGCRRPVPLTEYPRTRAYLERHRAELEGRTYVIEAGREWYEIWVPQDPAAWKQTKLIFRDISEEPTFWIDEEDSIVNGDCYWIICQNKANIDLLWLAAAVGNSTFIEKFYDCRFQNKLYAGRRRFITQYVEKFPLPDPHSGTGKSIIEKAKKLYRGVLPAERENIQEELDCMVWEAFGLAVEKPSR